MRKFGIPYIPYRSLLLSTTVLNDDQWSNNCAASFKSGWWHSGCYNINTNAQPPVVRGFVLFSEMKIRPKDCITQ